MHPTYDGVKCYGHGDWANGHNMEKAVPILDKYNPETRYNDVNAVLELYNIEKLLKLGRLNDWDEEQCNHYNQLAERIPGMCARYFAGITDENMQNIYDSVALSYLDDFWELFTKFSAYKRVYGETLKCIIFRSESTLGRVLHHKKLTQYYDKDLAECMRNLDQTVFILCKKFLEADSKQEYHIPSEFKPSDFEPIFQKYVDRGDANPNLLELISKSNSTKECPISDKLRLSAKRAYQKFWASKDIEHTGFEYGFGVSFEKNEEIITCEEKEPLVFHVNYDRSWIEDNLDYPTLLNNFIYLFDFFDRCNRSNFPIVRSQCTALERVMGVKGKNEYWGGSSFHSKSMLHAVTMQAYFCVLKKYSIDLENVFKWFFESYLQEEFSVSGFVFNPPSAGASLVEKCRTLSSEMDGVLKQFRMILEDGQIDRELLEMSSEHIVFSTVGSFISDKYAYCSSKDLETEMFSLFSDQCMLSYTDRTEEKYTSFYELLKNEKMKFTDFPEYSQDNLKWLQQRGTITISDDGYIVRNGNRVAVLKDLYDHDVVCPQHYADELRIVTDQLHDAGELRYTSTLFSEPEQEYLNYILNRSQFSNGLDLRNKYAHSTYPINPKEQTGDYVQLLEVMVLVIGKINEEFCLRDENAAR